MTKYQKHASIREEIDGPRISTLDGDGKVIARIGEHFVIKLDDGREILISVDEPATLYGPRLEPGDLMQ